MNIAQDTQPGVHQMPHQDFVDTIPVSRAEANDHYTISCPKALKRRPLGLDQQGRWPYYEHDDDDRSIGWGALLPALLAMSLVGACAALVLLLRDFT